jgi:hypothetical protein
MGCPQGVETESRLSQRHEGVPAPEMRLQRGGMQNEFRDARRSIKPDLDRLKFRPASAARLRIEANPDPGARGLQNELRYFESIRQLDARHLEHGDQLHSHRGGLPARELDGGVLVDQRYFVNFESIPSLDGIGRATRRHYAHKANAALRVEVHRADLKSSQQIFCGRRRRGVGEGESGGGRPGANRSDLKSWGELDRDDFHS